MKFISDLVVRMVKDCHANLKELNQEFKWSLTKDTIRNEFGILVLKLPRRSGKTHAVVEILRQIPTAKAVSSFNLLRYIDAPDIKSRIMSVNNIRGSGFGQTDVVVIDEAFALSGYEQMEIDKMIETLNRETLVVKIGT